MVSIAPTSLLMSGWLSIYPPRVGSRSDPRTMYCHLSDVDMDLIIMHVPP